MPAATSPDTKKRDKAAATKQREKIAELLNEGATVSHISKMLDCSRVTVYKVMRLLDDPEANLTQDRRENNKPDDTLIYSKEVVDRIIAIRQNLEAGGRMIYHTIMRDPRAFGFNPAEVPSPSTISRIIRDAGLATKPIGPKDKRFFPIDEPDTEGFITIDGWGAWNLTKGQRIYLTTFQDRVTRAASAIIDGNRVNTDSWISAIEQMQNLLLGGDPMKVLFTDNGVGMTVSQGHTPQSVRYALHNGARMVYIPPAQPWRNGRLERWHWSMEKEYWARERPDTIENATEGLANWLNYYNHARPHQSLKFKTPGDIAPWLKEFDPYDLLPKKYPHLEPQPGVIDLLRICDMQGKVKLWQEYMQVSPVFAGQYLRIRLTCEPGNDNQLGQVIWASGNKQREPLIVATFNHHLDNPTKGRHWLGGVRLVDFDLSEAEKAGKNKRINEIQYANQQARVGKKAKSEAYEGFSQTDKNHL